MTPNIETFLDLLPSRLYAQAPRHEIHQLVIEKFPNATWSASYVCIGCKGKTKQFIHPDLDKALTQLHWWVIEVIEEKHFSHEPISDINRSL